MENSSTNGSTHTLYQDAEYSHRLGDNEFQRIEMPQRMLSNYSEAELESSDSKTTGISPMCLEVKKWNPK